MKISKLLFLGVAFFLGTSDTYAVSDDVWQEPAVTGFTALEDGGTYYLYNAGSELLFTQGNAWGTQASVGKTGLKVRFDNKGDYYELVDFCKSKNQWLKWWFVEDGVSMYVDYNGQADWKWEVTRMSGDYIRLSPSSQNPNVNDNRYFVGLNRTEDPENTILTANCTESDGSFIDWRLVSEEAGDAYEVQYLIYEVAMQLKDVLNEAEEIGADVADQVAVYNNTNSTKEELQAAINEAKAAIEARMIEIERENMANATASNPVEVTDLFITNPSYVNNNNTGWSGDTPGFQSFNNAEFFQKVFNTYQDMTELLEGVYKISNQAFYRPGYAEGRYTLFQNNDPQIYDVKLYATTTLEDMNKPIVTAYEDAGAQLNVGTERQATTGIFIPDNMQAAAGYFAAGRYNNSMFFPVDDGNARIGLKNSTSIGGNWVIYDNWKLMYLGNGNDAWRVWLDESIADLENSLNLEGKLISEMYLTAYDQKYDQAQSATGKAASVQAYNDMKTAISDIMTNADLWDELKQVVEEANTVAANPDLDSRYTSQLANIDADVIAAHTLSNAQLQAEIERVKNLIAEAYLHPADGADMTSMLVNPGFENGATGWTRDAAAGGNVTVGGNANNHCYEAWNNSNFDIHQVVKNAPKGVYEISVQGFYRYGRGQYQAYLDGNIYTTKEGCPVFVYLNSNATPFTNVYGDPVQITDASFYGSGYESQTLSDGTVLYFPNNMDNAAVAFSNGMFTQSAYGLVSQDGLDIRIGVKGNSSQLGDSWCIWDNFKLYYRGFKADVVKPILEQAIAEAEANIAAGGIGSGAAADLQAAINQGKSVVNGTNGEAMFNALTQLYDLSDEIIESKATISRLTEANERLAAAIEASQTSDAIKAEAQDIYDQNKESIAINEISEDDVDSLIEEIDNMIARLKLPSDIADATWASPVDCTGLIVNPNYDNGNDEGWTGGATVNGSSLNAEKYNTNFNYFQDLKGLPEGYYTLSVQGFYRAGFAGEDYAKFIEDASADNNAILYATSGDNNKEKSIFRLASQAVASDSLVAEWTWASEEAHLIVPDRMGTANEAFGMTDAEGNLLYSNNNVTVKVDAEGKLTIGLKKDVTIPNDWTIWDNWKLVYRGLYRLGDVDHSGEISVQDISKLVQFILGDASITGFFDDVADMNGDGEITVQDISELVNAILAE